MLKKKDLIQEIR